MFDLNIQGKHSCVFKMQKYLTVLSFGCGYQR